MRDLNDKINNRKYKNSEICYTFICEIFVINNTYIYEVCYFYIGS